MAKNKLKIFDESNIVHEETLGMKLDSLGIYRSSEINVDDLIAEYQDFEDLIDLLESNADTPKNVTINNLTTKEKVDAMVTSIRRVDSFAHLIMKGSECPICGKHVDYMPKNGFCSAKCFAKDLEAKVMSHIGGNYPTGVEQIIDKLQYVLQFCNLILNAIIKLPDLLANIAKLPKKYQEFVTLRINTAFVRLKILINKLMIEKNKLLIWLFKWIKFGVVDIVLQPLIVLVQEIMKIVIALKEALNASMVVIINIMKNPMFSLPPHSYGFFLTPKSFMNPQTASKFIIQIPFDVTKESTIGIPTQNPFGMGASVLNSIDYSKIDKIIQAIFLPITEPEYLLDPEVFKYRYALSDQNTSLIKDTVQTLESLCVLGGDYLPRYQRLNFKNPWFIIAILSGWGPVSQKIFGDFIYHATL